MRNKPNSFGSVSYSTGVGTSGDGDGEECEEGDNGSRMGIVLDC